MGDPVFDKSISLALTGAAEQVHRLFVQRAGQELAAAYSQSHPSGHVQAVDGVPGAALATVSPFGVISFTFTYWVEVVSFSLAILRQISPRESGKYSHAHGVFVNGRMVTDFRDLRADDHVIITNTMVYARRLETPTVWRKGPQRGQLRGWSVQPQVPQPPDSIYRHACTTINRRYGNLTLARYVWVGIDADVGQELSGDAANISSNRYPALELNSRL